MYLLFDFSRNTLIIAVIIFCVLFFSLINIKGIDIPLINWLSNLIYNTITPILNLLESIFENIKDFFVTLFSIDEINRELTNLRQENNTLTRQIHFLENINSENKRLRKLLQFKEKVDYELLGAEVIANSPSIWDKSITINRGTADGLQKRMPVITYSGYLVGRLEKVGKNAAQVRLITDREFVVGAIIARADSREIALVRGSGRSDQANIMDNIAWDAEIEKGDLVLTSGLSNNFPSGLKIGKVKDIEADNYGLSQKSKVNLFINKTTLEEVMVITNFKTKAENKVNPKKDINSNEESEKDAKIGENKD